MEKDNVIYISLLGSLEMRWQGKQLRLGKNLSSKMLHLLLILLYSRDTGVRREQLLEQLYMDSDVEQASNSLRAIIFRLRRSLVAAGLPEGDYITTKGGIYRWQSDLVEVELDVERFQNRAAEAFAEKDPVRQEQLLTEALGMYRGEFLPSMIGDNWVAVANWKYQEIYFKCLRGLGRLLKPQGRYQELLDYCEPALARYPYEEWQVLKMECLIGMKEYRNAMEYYERVSSQCQEEFGMMPSEPMTALYRSIKNMIQYEMSNIEEIQAGMQPPCDAQGASQCDYLTFMDIYRYVVWVFERRGIQAFLVLFTITDRNGVPLESSALLEEARINLESTISNSVRKADLFARYGKNQYLMLMTGTDQAGCELAVERIRSRFYGRNHSRKASIFYTCQPAKQPEEWGLPVKEQ